MAPGTGDSAEGRSSPVATVDVEFACEDEWKPAARFFETWVLRSLEAAGIALEGPAEVAVRVVGAEESRSLNAHYRHRDKPTNVLSFPAERMAGLPPDVPQAIGDLVVCAPVVNAEAAAQGKKPEAHWAHMLVHGTLHLLGFDHGEDEAAAAMESLEIEVLGRHGIGNPYAAS